MYPFNTRVDELPLFLAVGGSFGFEGRVPSPGVGSWIRRVGARGLQSMRL